MEEPCEDHLDRQKACGCVDCICETLEVVTKERDQLLAEVERLKAGPSELLTMMVEADHMLGHYSTTRLALKALLKKYANISIKAADAELQVGELKKHLKYVCILAKRLGPGAKNTHREEALAMLDGTLADAEAALKGAIE